MHLTGRFRFDQARAGEPQSSQRETQRPDSNDPNVSRFRRTLSACTRSRKTFSQGAALGYNQPKPFGLPAAGVPGPQPRKCAHPATLFFTAAAGTAFCTARAGTVSRTEGAGLDSPGQRPGNQNDFPAWHPERVRRSAALRPEPANHNGLKEQNKSPGRI
jgi:hypothetical protein